MTVVVSRNTMRLASGASSVANFYNGFAIIVNRIDSVTGKERTQRKKIIGYDGTNKVITIEGLWDPDFIPQTSDTYQIVPFYADNRVSINLAAITMDYITSTRYGRGLDPLKDLNL